MATEIASLYARVGADISQFQRAMGQAKGEMSAFEKTHNAVGAGLKLAAGVGIAGLGLLGKGIYDATQQAADMEQQVANIAAVMGKSREEIEPLNDLILQLGINPQLKVSAVEAAQAIEMLAKNGLSMDEIMAGAAESTVRLANSTGADFATAADIATDAMAMFNIDAADMMKAVDGITGVTVSSKFDIDDYRLALAQAGGVASSVGVSFEDFNAVIADISPSFASGSDAGTSFKVFLQRLVPQSDAAKKAMEELGMEFFNADGSMKSMSEIAEELAVGFEGLSEEQKLNAASTIFGTDAMRAAFELAKGGAGDIDRLREAMANTDAIESSRTRMDTFSGALEILKGIIETLSISIGMAFLPAFRAIVESIAGFLESNGATIVDWFGRLAEAIEKVPDKFAEVRSAAEEWWGRIATFVRPFTDFIGQFVQWGDAIAALAIVLGVFAATTVAGLVTSIAPVVAVLAGVVAAVAVVRQAWETDWGGIRTQFERLWGILKPIFDQFVQTFQKLVEAWNGGTNEMTGAMEIAKGVLQSVWNIIEVAVSTFVANFVDTIDIIVKFLSGDFEGAWETAKGMIQRTLNAWKDIARIALSALKDIFGQEFERIRTLLDQFREYGTTLVNRFGEGLRYAWNDITRWFRDAFNALPDPIKDMLRSVRDWGSDIVQGIWNGVRDRWNQFTDWFRSAWQSLKGSFTSFFMIGSPSKLFAEYGGNIAQGLADGMQRAMPQVDAAVADMQGTVNVAGGGLGMGPDAGGGDGDLAAAIRALVAVLQQHRAGNQISVTVPAATGDTRSDLAATVQYLQALYA